MHRLLLIGTLALGLGGCFLDRSGTRGVDAAIDRDGGGLDGGRVDAGRPDSGGDAATSDAGSDAGLMLEDAGVVSSLDPLLVELPCGSVVAGGGLACDMSSGPDDSAIFAGPPGPPVPVVLRVRSVAELHPYDSTTGGSGSYRVGGVPRNPDWTVLLLTISDPPISFHLNNAEGFQDRCYALDYTIETRIRAGAVVTLHGEDGDGFGWRNLDGSGAELSVPARVPVTQPYDGQFAYVTLE